MSCHVSRLHYTTRPDETGCLLPRCFILPAQVLPLCGTREYLRWLRVMDGSECTGYVLRPVCCYCLWGKSPSSVSVSFTCARLKGGVRAPPSSAASRNNMPRTSFSFTVQMNAILPCLMQSRRWPGTLVIQNQRGKNKIKIQTKPHFTPAWKFYFPDQLKPQRVSISGS